MCRRTSLKDIPEKVGVSTSLISYGFDGNEAFDFFSTPLTYIEQPIEEMGKEAVRVLIEQINGSTKIVHTKLRHTLIKRQSSL